MALARFQSWRPGPQYAEVYSPGDRVRMWMQGWAGEVVSSDKTHVVIKFDDDGMLPRESHEERWNVRREDT